MDMFAFFSRRVQLFGDYSEDFYHSCQTKTILSRKHFNGAPVQQIVLATKTGLYIENRFWYWQCDLRQTKVLGQCQLFVDFVTAKTCRSYIKTTKALKLPNDIP